MPRPHGRSAFTLVELAVALAILAALAHLALRHVSHLRDARLAAAADRQLCEIRDAVYCKPPSGQAAGFLADMGRMPAGRGGGDASLADLLRMPEGALPFALREAVQTNLAVEAGMRASLAEPGVWVPAGWRGPYLALPPGRDEVLDPWGNPLSNPDSAGLDRLDVAADGSIVAARHFGPSASRGDPLARTVSILPAQGAESSLAVNISSPDAAGALTLKWFGPCSGMITGAVVSATAPGSVKIDGLTPGVRVIWDSVTKAPRFIDLKPGGNVLQLDLR